MDNLQCKKGGLLANHEVYMKRCLQLAALGAGHVAPNPMVGALLVYNGQIIGQGYHRQFGGPHAEVNCLESVKQEHRCLINQSTLYVSLEPCSHYGKTPPCSNLIIEHKIPKLVIACRDSFAKVNGGGIQQLKAAGIEVTEQVLEKEASLLNKRFFTFYKEQRPYIILKWAQSGDGYIAAANSQPVKMSNEITDRLVHKWRAEEAAILVGANTALHDNPSLTTRFWKGKNPVRIVIDRFLNLPAHLNVFDNSTATIIINCLKNAETGNLLFYQVNERENIPAALCRLLYQRGLNSLLVEGGTQTLQSFIDQDVWDEARVITNEHLMIGNGIKAPEFGQHFICSETSLLTDKLANISRLAKIT